MTNHDIVPTHLVIKAMRDSGYKNAAYAIAELMDNAIQADASQVELLCAEKTELLRQRQRTRISEIAVLDNGCGMDADVLRMALQFGNGTRLGDRSGIGRFGMGLPNSSISQARRVDVWTWQDGVDSAIHSYIDIDEVEHNRLTQVPEAAFREVPEMWRQVGKSFDQESGTLVVWSKLDRVMWKTAKSIIDNSEFLVGRLYRYFLFDERVGIRFASFDADAPIKAVDERFALPNDPMYLMNYTSCPDPFSNTPMFEQWGEDSRFSIRFNDELHEVIVRFSYAKEEAREVENGRNPGSLPHGKHANNNLGVSIVRAGRELDLDQGWTISYDPTERWWGVEVDFPPGLDDIFGLTNNKQSARNFSALANADVEALLSEHASYTSARTELDADEDPNLPLWEIANRINKQISAMRGLLKAQTRGTRPTRRHEVPPSQERGTAVTRKRIDEGYRGESDEQEEQQPPEQREEEIVEELLDRGVTETQAKELAAQTVGRGLKYTFAKAYLTGSPAFFDVKSRGGSIIISLNTNHPAYEHLVELLQEDVENVKEDELRTRLVRARDGLELLLMAWARYEDEQPEGKRRDNAQMVRWDWGKVAREFLDDED